MRATSRATWALAAAIAGLVGLHLWPPHGGPAPMLAGVLPWDLVWHVAWMGAAMLVVLAMTSRRMWPDDEEPRDE
jgi:hypothetical protein